jgi:hypothetical protein
MEKLSESWTMHYGIGINIIECYRVEKKVRVLTFRKLRGRFEQVRSATDFA